MGHHDEHLDTDDDGGVPFYRRPAQRQRWGDTQIQPHTNWGDTFFDLFYVAAAYNLGTLILAEPTARGVFYFVGCFYPVQSVWGQKMYYDARYVVKDDIFHRFYEIAILVVLATAVLHIRPVSILSNPADNIDMFTFALSISLANLLGIGRSLEIGLSVESEKCAKRAGLRDVKWYSIVFFLFLASTIVSGLEFYRDDDVYDDHSTGNVYESEKNNTDYGDDHRRSMAASGTGTGYYNSYVNDIPIWLMTGGSLVHVFGLVFMVLFLPGGGKHKEVTVPMNITFCIHRWGEWTMLMLGESVLSLLIVDVTESAEYYKTFFSGILSITLLEYLHFRSQPHDADDHAMRRTKEAGVAFTLIMQVYSAALVVLGASYKMLLYEYVYVEKEKSNYRTLFSALTRFLAATEDPKFDVQDRRQRVAHFFCISMAFVWFCLDAMILCHRGLKDNLGRCQFQNSGSLRLISLVLLLLRVGMIVFMATLSQYVTQPETLAFIGLVGIITQVLLRVVGTSFFGKAFHNEESESESNELWPNVTRPQALPSDKEVSD